VVRGTLEVISNSGNCVMITFPPEVVTFSDIPHGIFKAVDIVSGSPKANNLYGLLIFVLLTLIPSFVSVK
jgi:hypothetical protein